MAKKDKLATLRSLLSEQAADMTTGGGLLIKNKNFPKGFYRILPGAGGIAPGQLYVSFYADTERVSSTSPATFKVICPILDKLEELRAGGNETKEASKFAWSIAKPSNEYWMSVINIANPGTVESPNLQILRGKHTLYQDIMGFICNEEYGYDITDLVTGRPMHVEKVATAPGSAFSAEWKYVWGDRGPLSANNPDIDDNEFREAVEAAADKQDVRKHFYTVDWEKLETIYEAMFGCVIPQIYVDAWQDYLDENGLESEKAPAKASAKAPAKAAKKSKPLPETDEPEIEFGVTRCTFEGVDENDDAITIAGVILEEDAEPDDDGLHYLVSDDDDADGDPWSVAASEITLEAVEVAPQSKRRTARKPSAGSKVRGS